MTALSIRQDAEGDTGDYSIFQAYDVFRVIDRLRPGFGPLVLQ
jgi:hypothetical protein